MTFFCLLIVYLCSPTRWMPRAVPLLLFWRANARHISCKCEWYRRGENRWAIGWSQPYTLWSLEDIHFKPQSWCSLLFGFSLADVMVSICNGVHYVCSWQSHLWTSWFNGPPGSMLNGKVSKMSSLIAEFFKLVPFPNLDLS